MYLSLSILCFFVFFIIVKGNYRSNYPSNISLNYREYTLECNEINTTPFHKTSLRSPALNFIKDDGKVKNRYM